MLKECSGCKQSKLLIDFYSKTRRALYPDGKAGTSSRCRDCDKTARKRYAAKNKAACKASDRRYHLSRYGLTPEDYRIMLEKQAQSCLGCGTHQSELLRNLVVDHDHKTNKIRGLLCHQCNVALGLLRDNAGTLKRLINYLNNSRLGDKG